MKELAPPTVEAGAGPRPEIAVIDLLGSFDPDAPLDAEGLHPLVRRFRGGDPGAAAEILVAAVRVLAAADGRRPAVTVVPSHDGRPQAALGALAQALVCSLGWSSAAEALVRVRIAPEAKWRPQRDVSREAATLAFDPSRLAAGVGEVVLLDDVLCSGGTLAACSTALRRGGWTGEVKAVVIARATRHARTVG